MISFDWKKSIGDSIKDGLIITATTTRILFALKVVNVKPPKASRDAMDIIKKCWWNLWRSISERLCGLQEMDP